MRSRGEPLSTNVKVNTALVLKNAKTGAKIACFWLFVKIPEGQYMYKTSKIHNQTQII